MSWETKTDYCGLAVANKVSVKSANENRSGKYLEKLGQDGHIAATKPYGTANAAPSNEYVIEDAHTFAAGAVKLGKVTTFGGKKYRLDKVSGSSGAGQEPTFSGTCVQAEDRAADDFFFELPSFALSPDEVAQVFFGAFTLPEGTQESPKNTGVEITQVSFEASCTVGLHTKNGDPLASSIHTGHIVVNATLGQYGEQTPEISAASGWDISSPLTCDDPDSDMPSWSFSLSKPLTKRAVQAGS